MNDNVSKFPHRKDDPRKAYTYNLLIVDDDGHESYMKRVVMENDEQRAFSLLTNIAKQVNGVRGLRGGSLRNFKKSADVMSELGMLMHEMEEDQ